MNAQSDHQRQAPDGSPNTQAQPIPRAKRHWVRWVSVTLAGLLAVSGAVVTLFILNMTSTASSKVTQIPNSDVFPNSSTRPTVSDKAATNILLMGSDSREAVDSMADAKGNRSDTIMVLNIPSDGSAVSVMSIMRDSWVDIPGHGKAKINAAISWGGVPLAVETIENLIGVPIDHVAIVDFEGFKALTDALGGITLYNGKAFTAYHGDKSSFEKGTITVNGDDALAYVRERYAFADGDYQRVRNQQEFLKGAFAKLSDAGTLTDPFKLQAVVDKTSPYISVDEGLSLAAMVDLGGKIAKTPRENIRFFAAPTTGPGWAGQQSIINVDWDEMAKVKAAFQQDTVAIYASQHS